MSSLLRRHVCLFNGGPCCHTNCAEYRGLVEYSKNFLACVSRVIEEDKQRIKPPRIHGGRVEDAPPWLKAIFAPPKREEAG